MKNAKTNFIFIFFLVSGIILGSLLAAICKDSGFMSWISYGTTVGFAGNAPAVLDLAILKVTFGLSLELTVAHIICVGLAMFLYFSKWR